MLILASGSPRRRQLLAEAGLAFSVEVRPTDEAWPAHLPAIEVAPYLAAQKARAWQPAELADGRIVLTADTTVVLGGHILNKPADAAEAWAMLQALSGQTHQVVTGVALYHAAGLECWAEVAQVTFKPLSEAEIEAYIATGAPMDKAGAYGIQDGFGMRTVTRIEGDYYAIVGLPVASVCQRLAALGIRPM